MSTVTLRPRSGIELIDASFQFLRENFVLLFTAVVAAFAPVAVVSYLAAVNEADPGLSLLSTVVDWVFNSIAFAAAVVIVAKRYLGEDVSAADALRAAGRRLGTVLAVSFLYGLGIAIGTVLLVIPGIYIAATYFAAMPAAMVEGWGYNRAFSRSGALTEGSKLRVVGVYGLAYVLYTLVSGFINVFLTTLFGAATGTLLTTLFMACTYPFIAVVGTLLYFDLRIRREGFDLDFMMDAPAAAPAHGAAG